MYSAITRPRICGSVVSCTRLFAVVITLIERNPTGTRVIE